MAICLRSLAVEKSKLGIVKTGVPKMCIIDINNGSLVNRLYGIVIGICILSFFYLSYYDFVLFAGLKKCA